VTGAQLRVQLFGRFQSYIDLTLLTGLEAAKVQELFAYLLLYRERPHFRETLAGLLWLDTPVVQARKYLRQALWRLQAGLVGPAGAVLVVDNEWVQVHDGAALWLDVAVFEETFAAVHRVRGSELSEAQVLRAKDAAALYHGDLLEGCFQDWVLYDRERLQNHYLTLLEKLMDHCEATDRYEEGLDYGDAILCLDRAHERTHRRMMRLRYRSGDRTGALRQYQRCRTALAEELAVQPAGRTEQLHQQILTDALPPYFAPGAGRGSASAEPSNRLPDSSSFGPPARPLAGLPGELQASPPSTTVAAALRHSSLLEHLEHLQDALTRFRQYMQVDN
jgi:DNA-binding SARP family transcriptional activator